MKHKLFTTLLVMLMSMAGNNAFAQDYDVSAENDDGITIYYKLINEGSELEVVKGDGYSASTIRIPAEVNSKPVVRIGESAFSNCNELLSVVIPSSVVTITDKAFYSCKNLSTLNLPYGLKIIGENAFAYCPKIASVTLPNSLEAIKSWAFMSCGIESVYISQYVNEIGINPFGGCPLITIQVDPNNLHFDSHNNCNAIIETNTGKLIAASKQTIVPSEVKCIGMAAFSFGTIYGGNPDEFDIASIILPEGFTKIEQTSSFWYLHIGKLVIPSTIKTMERQCIRYSTIDTLVIKDIKAWCEAVEYFPLDGSTAFLYDTSNNRITDLIIPSGTINIPQAAFAHICGVNSVFIPKSVVDIGFIALPANNLNSVFVEWDEPISLSANICSNANAVTLYVPRGCKTAYEAADYWKDFKEIKEYGDGNATIAMGSSGIMTYSNSSDLNFTGVSGLKAYIASGFNPATGDLTMTRVYEVPAGEGILLKGEPGSYEVPGVKSDFIYANLLVGVPTATTVNPTDGSYTNFILANDEVKGIGFYPLVSSGEIGANKAYLQLPTSILPAASRSLRMVFEDEEEETTGINALNDKEKMMNDKAVYDLQGRRVSKPTRGLYIKDGKKIMVK